MDKNKIFVRIEIIDESDPDNYKLVWRQDFDTVSEYDVVVIDALYNKILELDSEFHFVNYDECPICGFIHMR